MTTINDLDDFKALEPFFRIIEQGLAGLADGEHFFELLAEDVVFDYIITTPGYPRHVEGRHAVAEFVPPLRRQDRPGPVPRSRCPSRSRHRRRRSRVRLTRSVVPTGTLYANRYISVLTIADRKVSQWRDYLDPVAVFDALGWPTH
jgi:ketosteroid isomerase-like protein